jgi:hypothetical protein
VKGVGLFDKMRGWRFESAVVGGLEPSPRPSLAGISSYYTTISGFVAYVNAHAAIECVVIIIVVSVLLSLA